MHGPTRPAPVLSLVGGTPLVALRSVQVRNDVTVLLKLESANPTGSMKDRMALAMIDAAERDGRVAPGGRVVEYTGGSTGVSLAFVCAAKGLDLDVVSSDAFAREKLDHMRMLGARVHLVASDGGRMTAALTREMIRRAGDIAAATGAYWTDQMHNRDQLAAYRTMAEEILEQTGGEVTAFVQSVGTAASLRGVAARLREHDGGVRIVAVEPAESAVLSGGPTGAHGIDGIGAGYVVPLWEPGMADGIEAVSTREANAVAAGLGRREGLLAGSSTGANVAAALRVAATLPPGSTVVTVMCDSGLKYLSKPDYVAASAASTE